MREERRERGGQMRPFLFDFSFFFSVLVTLSILVFETWKSVARVNANRVLALFYSKLQSVTNIVRNSAPPPLFNVGCKLAHSCSALVGSAFSSLVQH